MSLRQSFQHGCDFRSHPGCRLSLPRDDVLVDAGSERITSSLPGSFRRLRKRRPAGGTRPVPFSVFCLISKEVLRTLPSVPGQEHVQLSHFQEI